VTQRIEQIVSIAAAIVGLVGVLYVVGGAVMWLRFDKAGIPADQAVALMPHSELLAVGLRLMILPALVLGFSAFLLGMLLEGRSRFATAWRKVADRPSAKRSVQALAVLLALVFLAALPFAWASGGWLVGIAIMWVAWFLAGNRKPRQGPWILAAAAVLAATVVSLSRQANEPVQLLAARVTVGVHHVTGTYVAADATAVYLGTSDGRIRAYPRASVRELRVGPAEPRAPSPSAASRLLLHLDFAITPLNVWCQGERYEWDEPGTWCDAEPYVARPREERPLHGGFVGVRVTCPDASDHACKPYVKLKSGRHYILGDRRFSVPRLVEMPPQRIVVSSGRTVELCIPVNEGARHALTGPVAGETSPQPQPVPLRATLFGDRTMKSRMSAATLRVWVTPVGEKPPRRLRDDRSVCDRAAADELPGLDSNQQPFG
jgi:hypothetical protein